jgi:hypothetical protein
VSEDTNMYIAKYTHNALIISVMRIAVVAYCFFSDEENGKVYGT